MVFIILRQAGQLGNSSKTRYRGKINHKCCIARPDPACDPACISGHSPLSYQWYYKPVGGEWSYVGSNSSTYSRTVTNDFYLKVQVTDSDQETDTSDDWFVEEWGSKISIGGKLPDSFLLENNYPNPFNPNTTIRFQLPETSHVKLVVYDITGKVVAQLINRNISAGFHEVSWDASNMASGLYLCKITAGDCSKVIRMVLLK